MRAEASQINAITMLRGIVGGAVRTVQPQTGVIATL
jgi:hypothetical protein